MCCCVPKCKQQACVPRYESERRAAACLECEQSEPFGDYRYRGECVGGGWDQDATANSPYRLTTGGCFTGKTVSLAPGAPDWVQRVRIVDGDIYLYAKYKGIMLLVR